MPFFRFTTPTYGLQGGSFPGTIDGDAYSLINVTSGGVGAGGSAPVDSAASGGGPNAGTFFVEFGEDAEAQNVNRGLKVLAQNSDILDDIVKTSLPLLVTEELTGSVGALGYTDIVITGDVWVGKTGQLAPDISDIIWLTDSSGDRLLNPFINGPNTDNVPTVLELVHDGTGVSVLGTAADGFYTNPTIRYYFGVSGAYTFRVSYAVRARSLSNLRTFPDYVHQAYLKAQFAQDRASTALYRDLDSAYRRATSKRYDADTAGIGTAGSGGRINLNGKGIQKIYDVDSVRPTNGTTPNRGWGRYLAFDLVKPSRENHVESAGAVGKFAGYIGRASILSPTATAVDIGDIPNEAYHEVRMGISHSIASPPAGTWVQPTRIPAGAAATLNVGGASPRAITLDSVSHWFRQDTRTSIRAMYDILELDYQDGNYAYAYIESLSAVDERSATLRIVGEYASDSPTDWAAAADTAVLVTLLQPSYAHRELPYFAEQHYGLRGELHTAAPLRFVGDSANTAAQLLLYQRTHAQGASSLAGDALPSWRVAIDALAAYPPSASAPYGVNGNGQGVYFRSYDGLNAPVTAAEWFEDRSRFGAAHLFGHFISYAIDTADIAISGHADLNKKLGGHKYTGVVMGDGTVVTRARFAGTHSQTVSLLEVGTSATIYWSPCGAGQVAVGDSGRNFEVDGSLLEIFATPFSVGGEYSIYVHPAELYTGDTYWVRVQLPSASPGAPVVCRVAFYNQLTDGKYAEADLARVQDDTLDFAPGSTYADVEVKVIAGRIFITNVLYQHR